jgi:hypothetical protein
VIRPKFVVVPQRIVHFFSSTVFTQLVLSGRQPAAETASTLVKQLELSQTRSLILCSLWSGESPN